MPLNEETLAKLATTLAGDIPLYETVMTELRSNDSALKEKDEEIATVKTKLQESEERGFQYTAQISNLVAQMPIGVTNTPLSWEQKLAEAKNRKWEK